MTQRFKERVKMVLNLDALVKVVKFYEMQFVCFCKMQKINELLVD